MAEVKTRNQCAVRSVSRIPLEGTPFIITTSYAEMRSDATKSRVFASTSYSSRTLPEVRRGKTPSRSNLHCAIMFLDDHSCLVDRQELCDQIREQELTSTLMGLVFKFSMGRLFEGVDGSTTKVENRGLRISVQ